MIGWFVIAPKRTNIYFSLISSKFVFEMFLVWQAADANCIFIWYLVWNIHILNLAGDRLKLKGLYINYVSLNIAYVVKEWQGLRPELIINDSKVQYMYIYMYIFIPYLPFHFIALPTFYQMVLIKRNADHDHIMTEVS